MFLLEQEEFDQKEVVAFTESIDSKQFLQEMVTSQYSEGNLVFAKALQEALEDDTLLSLDEDVAGELSEQVVLMEERIEALKEICSLNEGLGFTNWYNVHTTGVNTDLPKKVQNKLKKIKTEEEKQKLIKDLEKTKRIAKSLSNKNPKTDEKKSKKDYWNDLKAELTRAGIYSIELTKFPILFWFDIIVKTVNEENGNSQDFIKGIDVLIKDVKAVKIDKNNI